jgi:Sulfotransferase family
MQHYTLLYILGSGHCGSTLLDLLLNGHSEILGLGEICVLHRHVAKRVRCDVFPLSGTVHNNSQLRAWIGTESHLLDTPFWQLIKHQYEKSSGSPFDKINLREGKWNAIRSWQAKDIENWARPNEVLLSCVHQVSGANVLTDASKFPHRLYLLQRSGLFDIKVIHLVRNGCAVVNSYLRKYGDFRIALRRWAGPSVLAFHLRRKFKQSSWLQLRYEELASKPEETLKAVCSFVGVNFEPEMLAYRGKPYFGVGGNRMRDNGDECIFLDDEWQRELSYKHRIAFILIGGWLNRLYGY